MNKKSIAGIVIAVAIIIVIVTSYSYMSPTMTNNIGAINHPVNNTVQVPPITSGHNYTINLNEAITVKNP